MESDCTIRNERLVLVSLCILFLFTRLPGILALPLFNDEAVYLYRAQQFPTQFMFTIHDGKLIHELILAALSRLPWDPLLTGRLLSVVCGGLTVTGLWLSGKVIGQSLAGAFAGLLYILSPLAIVHDRLAIPDAMLGSVASFLLAATLRLTILPQTSRWSAAGTGALVALAALVKFPGLFLFALPALVILTQTEAPGDNSRRWALLRMALIVTLLALAAFAPFNYGGAESHKVGARDLESQIGRVFDNVWQVGAWIAVTLPLPTLLLAGVGIRMHDTRRLVLMLIAAAGLFCAALVVIGSVLYPRYLLPIWPLVLLTAGLGSSYLFRITGAGRSLGIMLLAATLVWGAFFTVQYARNPADTPLLAIDRRQYIEKWSAGYNLPHVYDTLQTIAIEEGGITIISPVHERVVHTGPKIYLQNDPLISFTDIDFRLPDASALIRDIAGQRPVFALLDAEEVVAFDIERRFPELKQVREWRNPHSSMAFYLYVWSPSLR